MGSTKLNHWLRTIQEQLNPERLYSAPKGYQTCEQIADANGLSYSHTWETLRLGVKAGIVKAVNVWRPDNNGRSRPKAYFLPVRKT